MSPITAIRNKARRDLHEKAKVPAFYVSKLSGKYKSLYVRLHSKLATSGALTGDQNWAETRDVKPRVVFMVSDLADATRGFYFTFADGSAFQVEDTDPRDGITITANCARVIAKETLSTLPFPVPDEQPGEGSGTTPPVTPVDPVQALEFPIPSPVTFFRIEHNLNKFPVVVLKDAQGDEFEAQLTYVDRNTVEVRMTPPNYGMAIVT